MSRLLAGNLISSKVDVILFERIPSFIWLLALSWLWLPSASAQPPADPPDQPPVGATKSVDEIREAKTEIFHLKDAEGNLVKVANLSLEEFEQLYKLRRQLLGSKAPPEFAIEEVLYAGQATRTHATLNVRLKIRLVVEQTNVEWIRVPLGFVSTILQERATHTGPGDFFVTLDPTDGYVCWLKAQSKSAHTVGLKLIVPLQSAGDETRLVVSGPLARSRFQKFRVATAKAEVVDTDLSVTTQSTAAGTTDLTFDFSGGELQLAWLSGDRMEQKPPVQLLAVTATRVTIKSPEQITAQSELTVSATGGEIKSFEVRLPPGMQMLDLPQQDYRITTLPSEPANKALPRAGQRLLVVPTVPGPNAKLALEAIYRPTTSGNEKPAKTKPVSVAEFAGFEVVGAVKQSGSIDVVVEGNWSLQWDHSGDVRRVDDRPERVGPQQAQARFEFFSNQYSIRASVRPEKTRLRIEPRYIVGVSSDEVRLDISLAVQLRGGRQISLLLDLPGWTVDQVVSRPVELLDSELVQMDPSGKVRIPLALVPEATGGQFDLQILAHRDADLEKELKFAVPKPAVEEPLGAAIMTLLPATVVISPHDNIVLTPQTEQIRGLIQDTVPEDTDGWNLPRSQRELLFYRERGDESAPLFVADSEIRSGTVVVAARGKVMLDSSTATVQQLLAYLVDYEPVSQVLLDVPKEVISDSGFQVWMQNELPDSAVETVPPAGIRQLLPWKLESTIKPTGLAGEDVSLSPRAVISVSLPQQQIGSFRLALRYPYDLGKLDYDESTLVQIPLVVVHQVEGMTFEGHLLEVSSTTDLDVEPVGETWLGSPRLVDSENQLVRLEVSTGTPAQELPMSVLLRKRSQQSLVVVRQAWLQTYLTASGQRHRAVFRLTTNEPLLQLVFPESVSLGTGNIRVAINHQPVLLEDLVISAGRKLSLAVGQQPEQKDFVLEVWYWSHRQSVGMGHLGVEMPKLENARRMERFFWHLITPANEHLVNAPAMMTAEQQWMWKNGGWGRQPNLRQQDLEHWIGATTQDPVPSKMNQYLFTSIGPVIDLQVRTLARATILLIVSGVTLLIGLLLIYVPVFRHPVSLLCVGLVLLCGALLAPESILLVSQAAALGLVLVLVARILNWVVVRRQYYRWPSFSYGAGLLERQPAEHSKSPSEPDLTGSSMATTFSRELPTSEPGA
jgi:hypothetical protein